MMGKRTNTAVWLEKYGRWQINIQKDGKRRTFYSSKPGRAGQRECQAKADAWLDDNIDSRPRRVEEVAAAYLEDCRQRTSYANARKEESICRVWILPQIGHIRFDQLGEQHLQKVVTAAFAAGKSEKTLKNIRATLMALAKFARRCRWSTFRPEEINIPRGAARGTRSILQPAHLVTLFTEDTTLWRGKRVPDPLILAYRLQVLTGLRPGELLGLQRSDRWGNTVVVQRSINIYGEVTTGKNENARRRITLTPTALSVWQAQEERTTGSAFLFPYLQEHTYRRYLQRYCAANGLPAVTPYELRHTFVSAVQSLPEGWVRTLVGHSQSMDTFGVYAHATQGLENQIAQKLQEIFDDLLKSCV